MHETFREFLDRLREHGELVDIKQPVDIRHIATLVDQSSKALMLERAKQPASHNELAELSRCTSHARAGK